MARGWIEKLSVIAVLLAAPLGAEAQDGHPRRAVAMSLMTDAPAVWIADDRAWAPTASEPISLCVHGRCRPIVEQRSCEPPECPGAGTLLVASGPLGSIDDFPDDAEGFAEELDAMRSDAALGPLAGYFGRHPDLDRDEDDGGGVHPSLSIGGLIASGGHGKTLLGGTAAAGLVYRLDIDEAFADPDDDGAFFATMVGDRFGIETRVRAFREDGTQALTYTVGGAFVLRNRIAGSVWQVPSVLGLFLPELGAFVRDGHGSFYAGFGLPLRVFATRAAALEVRTDVLIVSKLSGDEGGALLSFSLQGALE